MKAWVLIGCFFWSGLLFGQLPKNSLGLRLGYGNLGPDAAISYHLRVAPYFRFEINAGSRPNSGNLLVNGSAFVQYVKSFFPKTNFYAGLGYYGSYASIKFSGGSTTDINAGLSLQIGFEYRLNKWSLTADFRPYPDFFGDSWFAYSAGIGLRYHLNYQD